jgi:hypothetical protein
MRAYARCEAEARWAGHLEGLSAPGTNYSVRFGGMMSLNKRKSKKADSVIVDNQNSLSANFIHKSCLCQLDRNRFKSKAATSCKSSMKAVAP